MPAVLSLFGTLIVVVLTAWLNTRSLSAQIEAVHSEMRAEMGALRAEIKQAVAELELHLSKQILELTHRVERLEEARGLVRPLGHNRGLTPGRLH